jgi:CMP-N,N'-diacetyllegionaminic acid synthase
MIAWTIDAAREASALDRFIVSTDDAEIAALARDLGAEVPFMRPPELARDDTPDLPVFQHALEWLERREGYRPEVIVHLRPTQPLRTASHIDAAVQILLSTGADSVKSVREVHDHPHKMWRLDGDRLFPHLDTEFRARVGPDYPRQQLERLYVSSGVVDVVTADVIRAGSTTGENVRAYTTDATTSVDLDTELDFRMAEMLLADRD